MMWDMNTVKRAANFEYTYVIDLDQLVDMSEGVAMDVVMDYFTQHLTRDTPTATGLSKKQLEINATRDMDYHRVTVVVRWNRGVSAVYIPSEDKLFVPSWPVGLGSQTFRLPVEPQLEKYTQLFGADPNKSILRSDYKTYRLCGFDPEQNAWVYEDVSLEAPDDFVMNRGRGATSMPVKRRTKIFTDAVLRGKVAHDETHRLHTQDELREMMGLEPMKNNNVFEYNSSHTSGPPLGRVTDDLQELRSAFLTHREMAANAQDAVRNGRNFRYNARTYSTEEIRRALNREPSAKNLPVRESGLGIW